jgi:pectinacetylesterase
MKRPRIPAFRVLALVALLGCAGSWSEAANPLAGLQPGWNRIPGAAGTGCAQDSTYAFYVRPGDSRRLMIYFDGGGACWDNRTCDLQERYFTRQIDSSEDRPAELAGILELSNPRNPVRDFTIAFAPYCTGDVFLGTRTVTYGGPDTRPPEPRFQIRHQGAANAESVLRWVFDHVTAPDLVFVTGGSAGAVATPFYASRLAVHYPRARVVQLGDGAGGYRAPAVPAILAHWGAVQLLRQEPAFRALDTAALNFETLYVVASRTTPHVTFAQFNTSEDAEQLGGLSLSGVRGIPLEQLLRDNFTDITRANPRFRTYTGPGQVHTILRRPEFYTLVVDGVSFRDWVARLLEGGQVRNVGQNLLSGGSH